MTRKDLDSQSDAQGNHVTGNKMRGSLKRLNVELIEFKPIN